MENNIKFKELIYTSSQKSIVSGMSGFQVRTHSADFDSDLIDALGRNDLYGYRISSERMLTLSQIQENPKIVYDYPVSFTYKKITINETKQKYVFVRTVYIGIDYGYFCDGGAMRTGSNYFTHVLVFDQEPPREIFTILLENNVFGNTIFLPLDYTCSPDNKELARLLTGDPSFMPDNSFVIANNQYPNIEIADYMSDVIFGVLELYIQNKNSAERRHLIVKAPDKNTALIAGLIKTFLPASMAKDLTFVTNYAKDGIPDEFDIVFVNEFYTGNLYEEDHICIDLLGQNHKGIEKNLIHKKITEYIQSKDKQSLSKLLDYLAGIDLQKSTDYDFLLSIFILTQSDNEVPLSDLSPQFIKKFSATNQYNPQIWEKINQSINAGLEFLEVENIASAMSVIESITESNMEKHLQITEKSKETLTQILFGTNEHFGKLVNSNNVKTISCLINPGLIYSIESLLQSLNTSAEQEIWKAFLSICLSTSEKNDYAEIIISNIIHSKLSKDSIYNLLAYLYPSSDGEKSPVYSFIKNNPNEIDTFSKSLENICLHSKNHCFSDLLGYVQDANFAKKLSPIIETYFKKKLETDRNPVNTFEEFVLMLETIQEDRIENLNMNELLNVFIDAILSAPSDKYANIIDKLLKLNLKMASKTANTFSAMLSIFNKQTPQYADIRIMNLSYSFSSQEQMKNTFDIWIKEGFSKEELKIFIKKADSLVKYPAFIRYILVSIWNADNREIKSNKKEFIETILDNVRWDKADYDKFIKENKYPDLVNFIASSSGFFNKLIKKIFNKK